MFLHVSFLESRCEIWYNTVCSMGEEKRMMKKLHTWIRGLLPGYGWACLIFLILCQCTVFWATRIPLMYMKKMDLAISLDARIPFRPGWISIYVLSFVSWVVTFFLLFRQRKEHVYRNCAAYFLTLVLTGATFLLVPGAIQRPEVTGSGFFPWLTRVIYACDQPNNLCPSLHVVCSYYCWRAIWDTEGIPLWYRRFNFVFLLLVCCSILFVKQHVVVDIPTGVLVSEVPLQLAKRFRWERLGYHLEKRLEAKRASRR